MVGRGIVHRGRSDAACGLWGGTGDCARQRAAGTRLGIGTHVPDGRHQGGIECRSSARASDAKESDCRRTEHAGPSGRAGAVPTKHFCAGESTGAGGSTSEPRRAYHRAGANSESVGVVWRSGAGRNGSAGCSAGAAGELQCERLYRGLSFVPLSRLHLSAKRRAAQALFKVRARRSRSRQAVPRFHSKLTGTGATIHAFRLGIKPGRFPTCGIELCATDNGGYMTAPICHGTNSSSP